MVVNKGQWKDQLHLLNDFVNTQRKFVFEDEKDFPPQIPTNQQNNRVYFSGSKNDINNNRLFHEINKFTKKVLISAVVSWNGISKPFLLDKAI